MRIAARSIIRQHDTEQENKVAGGSASLLLLRVVEFADDLLAVREAARVVV